MTTFPSIAPVYPASKGSAAELSGVQLGDGYKARYSFGLNNTKPEWRLEWLVDQISSDAIDLFLQSCADSAEFFQWKPPDSASELNWRCDEWTVEQQSYDLYSVKATFKRAFEPSIITLTAQASTACYQDELCAQDYGTISSTVGGQTVKITGQLPTCTGQYTYIKITYIKSDGSSISEYYNYTTGNVTVNGTTYSYSLDGTTIQTVNDTWEINRWIDYLRTGYKITTDTQCSTNVNPTALTWPTYDYNDPTLYGPITSDWTPTNGGYPLIYNGTCQYKTTCLKWEASGYGQTSFVQVCRGATLTQFGPAFWGGFGSIGDPSQTYKYPQFYYSFCDGYSWQIVNNGGAIYLPYAGARLPEFHLSVYQP